MGRRIERRTYYVEVHRSYKGLKIFILLVLLIGTYDLVSRGKIKLPTTEKVINGIETLVEHLIGPAHSSTKKAPNR